MLSASAATGGTGMLAWRSYPRLAPLRGPEIQAVEQSPLGEGRLSGACASALGTEWLLTAPAQGSAGVLGYKMDFLSQPSPRWFMTAVQGCRYESGGFISSSGSYKHSVFLRPLHKALQACGGLR